MTAVNTEPRTVIDREFAESVAREWIAAWNAHDLERILSHYAEDAEMASPFIRSIAGVEEGVVRGRDALRAYWSAALGRVPDLHFTLRGVYVSARSVALHYDSSLGHSAVECLEFGPDRKVTRAAAHYSHI
jgi:ketosteroid isomerase-like protein